MKLMETLLGSLAISGAWLAFSSEARAACPGGPDGPSVNISRTFASGAKWSFDVQMTPCEGLMINNVRYQPAFAAEMQVFARASLAEIHVPYDNNAARFLDVTDSTNGLGTHAITLSAEECDGTRDLSNKICIEDEDHGYRWKYHESFAEMHSVAVFSAAQLGEYTYINRWEFHEDGTIEPQVGLTGALQIISSNAAEQPHFGSSLGVEGQPAQIGLNHMHNFYYRLDFDIAGAANDVVQRINYAASSLGASCTGSACGRTSFTPVTTEARQTWSATGNTSWLVQDKSTLNSDGRRVGYEVKPHYSGIWRGKTDGTEPWSQHDLFVTRYTGCERYAVRNVSPRITGCPAATPQHVFDMVNGEATDGQDVVVWFVNRHHHVTRDEDQFNMPIEWTGFHISPRSFAADNPAP